MLTLPCWQCRAGIAVLPCPHLLPPCCCPTLIHPTCDLRDLYFYDGPLPTLMSLDRNAIHLRMRCHTFASPFTEHHISADNHHVLRRVCGANPLRCDCSRIQPGCPANATRADDAFALVPRQFARAYFSMHDAPSHLPDGVPSPSTNDLCPTWQSGNRCSPGCHARPECLMTRTLLELTPGVRLSPTPLYFAIARTRGKKWGSGARLGVTFLSSPLKNGKMDARANVAYRCL